MKKIALRVIDACQGVDGMGDITLTALGENGCTWSGSLPHGADISGIVTSSGLLWQSGYDRQQWSTALMPRVLVVRRRRAS